MKIQKIPIWIADFLQIAGGIKFFYCLIRCMDEPTHQHSISF